jgi:membrane protease YdiL (CAAX protease family)
MLSYQDVLNECRRVFQSMTVDIWRQIDSLYKREEGLDGRALCVFVTSAVVLLTAQFFCVTDFITSFNVIRQSLQDIPHAELYPLLYWALTSVFNYCLLPMCVIVYVFREDLRAFGIHIEQGRELLIIVVAVLAAVLPLVFIASTTEPFLRKYPFYRDEVYTVGSLLLWEAAYGLQFVALEFFFRGFMLFGLARFIGSYAIFVMALPYTMIHFTKPFPEAVIAFFAGIVLGTLALRTRSLYGGVVVHVTVAWSMDLLSLYHRGILSNLYLL